MKFFIEMIKQNKEMRQKTEEKVENSLKNFLLARSLMADNESFEEGCFPT